MASIKLNGITKTFGEKAALSTINLEIEDKEFFVLLGPTGAGKTTMLRVVAGLEKPDVGDVFMDDERVNEIIPAQRDVAFVFQSYTLYPTYTVRENLEFPLKSKLRNLSQEEIDKNVNEAAKVLHIEHLLDRRTTKLSGGEMQRVSIGRAIVRSPKVFLMDEPLTNLDAKLREEMRAELSHLHFDLGSTFFYVTHDQIEAMTMADRIGVLNEGEIQQIGTPDEIYGEPHNMFVAKTVGSPAMNFITMKRQNGNLVSQNNQYRCPLTNEQAVVLDKHKMEEVVLGIRPEDITVSRKNGDDEAQKWNVHFKQSMGAEDILNINFNNIEVKAISPPALDIQLNEKVNVEFSMGRSHLFDPKTEMRLS